MHLNLTDPRLIAGVVVIVLIIVVAVALYMRNRRKTSAGFRKRFGSEYDRAVLEHGSERKAETKLADRETRVENLKIRALTAADVGGFPQIGSRCNPALSITRRARSRRPISWSLRSCRAEVDD
jgi:hypothetical protein